LYGFVGNNGVSRIDKLGRSPCSLSEIGKTRLGNSSIVITSQRTGEDIVLALLGGTLEAIATDLQTGISSLGSQFRAKAVVECETCTCTKNGKKFGPFLGDSKYEWVVTPHEESILGSNSVGGY
jgi:hypothetical protein